MPCLYQNDFKEMVMQPVFWGHQLRMISKFAHYRRYYIMLMTHGSRLPIPLLYYTHSEKDQITSQQPLHPATLSHD